MPEVSVRRPLRWRVAEAFEGPRGWVYIVGITAAILAMIIVPYVFLPFEGRPRIIQDGVEIQTEIRCLSPFTEVRHSIDINASGDPRQICVDHGRTRIFVAAGASVFVLIFSGIWLLSRAGRIQPRELAR
ncbi:MAG: hypothetical protein ACRDKS_06890 [Actinomycetota bacterium]